MMSAPCMCTFGRLRHYFKVQNDEWEFPMCNLDFRIQNILLIAVIVCVWIFCVVLFILFTVSLHVWQVWQNAIEMHRTFTVHACPNSPIFSQCLHLFLIMIENNSQICVKIFVFTWLNRIWNIHIQGVFEISGSISL